MNTFTGIEKLVTHIPGFDLITNGGLPIGRTTLVSGTAGSAKTVFASQFIAAGIQHADQPGVFVTFEESARDIRNNMRGFGWDIPAWEADGQWLFIDASPEPGEEVIVAGSYDFGALLARLEHAIKKVAATRVAMDSIGAIFSQFSDNATVRRELLRVVTALRRLGVTAVLTAERVDEFGAVARFGVEEFVADNVIILRNVLEQEKRRRTIEILKFRGTTHQKGEWPFTIVPDQGIVSLPLSEIQLSQHSSVKRVTSGDADLDSMCGGGFFRDSVVVVSGATGTGKTLLSSEFIAGGVAAGERCLLFGFEESREQIVRNALGWGFDFEAMERSGQLRVVCNYPETASLEDHMIAIKKAIEEFQPNRLAIDSLTALERVSSSKGFREFVVGLVSFIKHRENAALLTSSTTTLLGGDSVTDTHISTITDAIILLRYVEVYAQIRRCLAILKMRGSQHDRSIREFTIDAEGLSIGQPFRGMAGILAGNPVQIAGEELDRLDDMFRS